MLTVIAQSPTPGPAELAPEGTSLATIVGVGLILIVIGVILVIVARKR